MAFVLQDVINEIEETRSLDPLKKLKKENLVKVAAHYRITPAVGATKSHILDLIIRPELIFLKKLNYTGSERKA